MITPPEDPEITAKELAARWRIQVGTLAVWRIRGIGLPYNKRGGKVTYYMSEVLKYEQKNRINVKKSEEN